MAAVAGRPVRGVLISAGERPIEVEARRRRRRITEVKVMPGRFRAGAVGAALLTALTGCSTITAFTNTPVLSPASPPAGTAALAPLPVRTVATPKSRTAAPALKTTGAAWPAILTSLTGYGQWLLANPDPALVANVAEPGCAMANLIARQITSLLAEDAYLVPSKPVLGPVTGPAAAPAALGNRVILTLSASRPTETVLSRTGQAITEYGPLPSTALRVTLFRGTDGKWRFCTVDAIADVVEPGDPSVPLL
jgi:hypothetical protein